jgi:hypothetical protein
MNKQIDIEEALEQLKSINAPTSNRLSYPQLMHKIHLVQREKAPKTLLASSIIGLVLVLSCNLWTIDQKTNGKKQNLVEDLGLMNHLSIYGTNE